MKFANKFIAIDVETTDLDPTYGEVIQIGAVVVNEDCTIGAEFETLVKPMTAHRNARAMAVNCISAKQLMKAPIVFKALTMFEDFVRKNIPDMMIKDAQLAAYPSYFDIPYLKSTYTRAHRHFPFSYKSLDLKSIVWWEFAKRDMPTNGHLKDLVEWAGLTFEGEAHDGLTDIKNSIRLLQKLL